MTVTSQTKRKALGERRMAKRHCCVFQHPEHGDMAGCEVGLAARLTVDGRHQ